MADKCVAIIPAAGQGKRMNASVNKQFLSLQGMPVIVHTLRVFDECAAVDEIILVAAAGEEHLYRKLITEYEIRKLTGIVTGGRERQDSVYNGVLSIRGDCEIVIIHDGARPLITQDLILKTIAAAQETGAAVVCVPVKDTIKVVGENQRVKKTLDRQLLWQAQTPQAFRYGIFIEAIESARADRFMGTDDTSLVERLGGDVKVVLGSYENLKITTPEDLILAEAIMARRNKQCG
ncbi:2-C-methyl-D-erythritol 4-phosphate cytidylyltransferase [Thermincola ferriacetica]|uniref:2-C-methyl-D-erythritol 4-phosphate cytidylyltransferase n=1 Tax=Thermincola ferriacetica TaxID=281456 RepID=A0A0L6VZA3_9FIRM|nr:2-C-methyl-D-erythritol 4-phosphate cytidylyltransferase [Thermincola ferriacetica]KNZ68463.1 2-C-methyl-D-erythritol 4-phosphate cytidylyltransferase [Thermincola ferriacetica]